MIKKYLNLTRPRSYDTAVVARGDRYRRLEAVVAALALLAVVAWSTYDPCDGGMVYGDDGVYDVNACTNTTTLAIAYGDA